MHETKCPCRAREATQHNLCGCQFVLVQNLFSHQVKRKSETIVESHAINCYTFDGWLIHGCICLLVCTLQAGGIASRGRSSLVDDLRVGKVTAQTILQVRADEELIDAPSEDECLDELSKKKEEEVSPEAELVLVEATSASNFDELVVEQGLPYAPSANNSSGDLMRGVDLVFTILRTWKSII
ncbi:LOW QUALITY PROTEIN: hypothetical protein Cgig2_002965 [Carnegiea gigantea]|uniref:Uncharacterized protein n=1 Tax=Carnegiea gigantea TaxID=171969 RepID=A0A9Q1JJF7_9CARY|nr:LOW QUALITY PROTEIN: hypothetical protein Cgig2_002965 [Carnegiea gigantea]